MKTSAHYIKQIFVIIRKRKFVVYIIGTQSRSAAQLYTFDIYSRSVLKNFISGGLRTIIGKWGRYSLHFIVYVKKKKVQLEALQFGEVKISVFWFAVLNIVLKEISKHFHVFRSFHFIIACSLCKILHVLHALKVLDGNG